MTARDYIHIKFCPSTDACAVIGGEKTDDRCLGIDRLLDRIEDDRAHAEAEKIRKEAEATAAAGREHDQVDRALRASGAMHYVADQVDPYETRDGRLVRKSDGAPVAITPHPATPQGEPHGSP